MRGADATQVSLFTVTRLADFVSASHPPRSVRQPADEAPGHLSGLFSTLDADCGRGSIAPQKLMRAQLPPLFYPIPHGGLRCRLPIRARDASRREQHIEPPQRHRWPDHPPCRVCTQPANARLDRNALRLAQGPAGMRQIKQRGRAQVEALFQLAMAASNPVRLPKLIAAGVA